MNNLNILMSRLEIIITEREPMPNNALLTIIGIN